VAVAATTAGPVAVFSFVALARTGVVAVDVTVVTADGLHPTIVTNRRMEILLRQPTSCCFTSTSLFIVCFHDEEEAKNCPPLL